jgi:hypothetical protein
MQDDGAGWLHHLALQALPTRSSRSVVSLQHGIILSMHQTWWFCVPHRYLLERDILPYALLGIVSMGVLQSLLTEFPLAQAQGPYYLPASLIGVR